MRRYRYWLIGLVGAAMIVSGSVAVYFTFIDTAYSRAEFYSDTGIVPRPPEPESVSLFTYQERPGHVTFVLTRGEPHGTFTTEHDWWEIVSVELPLPPEGTDVDLTGPGVRVGLNSYKWRQFPSIGAGGIRGDIRIDSVGKSKIAASYDIVIDCVYPRFVPEKQHREVVFRGRSTFRSRTRPEDRVVLDVWPKPGQPSTPKQ